MFERWLRAHKNWWSNRVKNVPQQMSAALKDETFYTQAIPTDAAVVNYNALPIAKPAAASFAFAILGARTQDALPDAADEVFVAALANGKVYVAYGSINPKVEIPACLAIKKDYNKKAEKAADRPRGQADHPEGLRQARRYRPTGRRRLQEMLHPARAAAAVVCRGDEAGAGVAGDGDGTIAPGHQAMQFAQ